MTETVEVKINRFLDSHIGDCFSVFTIAAHIGENHRSVGNTLARLANENKLKKRERGYYETKKGPGVNRGLSMPFELPGPDPFERINPNPEERGNHETKSHSNRGCGDPDRRCTDHRNLDIVPILPLTTGAGQVL